MEVSHPVEEIKRLQRCINDLVSVVTLPAVWSGGDSPQIVHTLLEALLSMLPLDFIYLRLRSPEGETPFETVRTHPVPGLASPLHGVGDAFLPWLELEPRKWPSRLPNPIGAGDISILPLRLGVQGEIGVIVAGAAREDFPGQTERLVLTVAANQAAVGLQDARLLSQQKRVANELDHRVEGRTRELAAANQELKREIAERERAEAARRNLEEQFRNVVETANDAVVRIDQTGRILYTNPAMTRIFGYSSEELIGNPLTILMPVNLRGLHEAGFQRYLDTGRRHLNWQGIELTALHKNGNPLPVEVSFGEVKSNGQHLFTGFVRDITERKQAEESLRRSEERFRLLVKGVQDYAILMLDPEGWVVTWNEGAERISGYLADEILGRHFSKFYEEADVELGKPRQELLEADASGRSTVEGWRVRKNGSRFWAEVITTSIREREGRLIGFAKIVRDLTERKRFERALQHERDRLRLLLDLNNRIASNLDLRQLFRTLLEELRRTMECELAGLALPESKGDQLRVDVLEHFGAKGSIREGMLIPVHESPSGQAFRTAKPVVLGIAGRGGREPDPRFATAGGVYEQAVTADGFKASCFLPLILRDQALGILHLAWRVERPFGQEDVDFLKQIASQISIAVDNALNYRHVTKSQVRLTAEKQYLEEEIRKEYNPDEIVGDSPGLLKLLQVVEQVAPTDSNVLISGETGTGKELIARAVHSRSGRKDRPLVKVNCGAIPAGLVESELFGHVKGAFTGATTDRTGRFELADGGTLFLDEVGELPLDTQVKLLRVLQEQEFEPVGSSRTVHVDVRIIAASNRNLADMVREGLFRSDLFYRLNVLPLHVPSLRERQTDIPQILMFFLVHYSKKMGKKISGVPLDTMERMIAYPWPGNIRELRNVIERGVVLSPNSASMLAQDLLPPEIFQNNPVPGISPDRALNVGDATAVAAHRTPPSGAPSLEDVERQHIFSVLEQTGWKISGPKGAAEVLKLHPNTLRDRMNRLGISRRTRETP